MLWVAYTVQLDMSYILSVWTPYTYKRHSYPLIITYLLHFHSSVAPHLLPAQNNRCPILSKSTMADLQKYRPEALAGGASGSRGESAAYAAWHIRTEEGEKYGWYHPVYPHIVKKPPGKVCPEYTAIMERAAVACPRLFHGGADQIPIFIATNR